ncbi:hypothetical protein D3C75_1063990 [compost metagenome]
MRIDLRLQRMQLSIFFTDGRQLHAFDQLLDPPDHPVKRSDENIDLLVGRHIDHPPEVSNLHLPHLADQLFQRRGNGLGNHGSD